MAENFLDDIAKFGNNALTAMDGMQRQVRKWAVDQVDSAIKSKGLITQEDLDAQTEALNNRIGELEKKLANLSKPSKPAAAKKSATPIKKKAATTKKAATVKKTVKKKAQLKKAS